MDLTGRHLGEFKILKRLDSGAMGDVYKARQDSLGRFAAIKTIQTRLARDPDFVARFHQEARAAAGLHHTNLVQVYSAGESEGVHWFAMEFIDGESAQARLERERRLHPAEAVAIVFGATNALEYGWRKAHLIHRDIKPANIFLSRDGEVKLGDFGLAKSSNQTAHGLTHTGDNMGTPLYISPEQIQSMKDVDFRSDIYSLGCTLFHFIVGQPPYIGESVFSLMVMQVNAPVPDLRERWPECPAELAKVVKKMMQKNPGDRPQTYSELQGQFAAILDHIPALKNQPAARRAPEPPKSAKPAPSPPPPPPPPPRVSNGVPNDRGRAKKDIPPPPGQRKGGSTKKRKAPWAQVVAFGALLIIALFAYSRFPTPTDDHASTYTPLSLPPPVLVPDRPEVWRPIPLPRPGDSPQVGFPSPGVIEVRGYTTLAVLPPKSVVIRGDFLIPEGNSGFYIDLGTASGGAKDSFGMRMHQGGKCYMVLANKAGEESSNGVTPGTQLPAGQWVTFQWGIADGDATLEIGSYPPDDFYFKGLSGIYPPRNFSVGLFSSQKVSFRHLEYLTLDGLSEGSRRAAIRQKHQWTSFAPDSEPVPSPATPRPAPASVQATPRPATIAAATPTPAPWLTPKLNGQRVTLPVRSPSEEVAVLKTSEGEMVVEFWPEIAPNTVANFVRLAKSGFYDGTAFHRIMKDFMVQGGDPLTKDASKEALWGTGVADQRVKAEFSTTPHDFGVISMARGAGLDSASCQFFICLARVPQLDDQYTCFGKVIAGGEVLRKLGETPVKLNATNELSRPVHRVALESVKIVRADSLK